MGSVVEGGCIDCHGRRIDRFSRQVSDWGVEGVVECSSGCRWRVFVRRRRRYTGVPIVGERPPAGGPVCGVETCTAVNRRKRWVGNKREITHRSSDPALSERLDRFAVNSANSACPTSPDREVGGPRR